MLNDQTSETMASRPWTDETLEQQPTEESKNSYPLAMARVDECLMIASIHGGKQFRRQLMDMGLRPGMRIIVKRAGGRGPLLVSAGNTRLGIGLGMAEKIEVTPVSKLGRG